MSTAAERARRARERTHRELALDVHELVKNCHDAAVLRALNELPNSALRTLLEVLSDAPRGLHSVAGEGEEEAVG